MREPGSSQELVCGHCHAHFRRREHLERHSRRHLELRPFPCQWCSRSFARKDSLKRHVATHGPNAVRSYATTASQEAKRVARACMKCTKSKQRCNGQQPCDRCQKKRWICEYSSSSVAGSEEPLSLLHQPQPPATIEPSQVEIYHQGTEAPNDISLDQPDISHSTELMDDIFNPFPFMPIDNIDPSLALFPSPFFLDSAPQNAGFLNGNLHPVPLGSANTQPFGDEGEYSSRPSIFGTSTADNVNSPTADSQPVNTAKGIATISLEQSDQRNSTLNTSDSSTDEQDILASEDFCHVERISEGAHNAILNFYREHCQKPNIPQPTLPTIQVINTFIQLYFEYFHPVMPIIHLPTFKPTPDKWILLAAIASIGCQYSRIPSRSRLHSFFWRLMQSIILNLPMQRLLRNDEVHIAQAVLLHNMSLLDGAKDTVCTMQYQRNILITLCRPFLVGQASPFTRLPSTSLKENGESWSQWALSESWKRTIYFTWSFECFQGIMFGLPPALEIWELRVGLPSDDVLWECTDSTQWQRRFQSQEDPISLVHLFSSLKSDNSIQSLSQSSRLITIISLFSEEKRLRKQTQNLPYSALLPSTDPLFHSNCIISDILRSHFESFDPCQHPHQEPSALSFQQHKLYHLLSILRHIPPNIIHASYGWMTTKANAEIADSQVADLLRDTKRARQSLVHAATLFKLLREQNIVAFYDPFCILFAVQYIYKYTRHVLKAPSDGSEDVEQQSCRQPVRIDRLNPDEQKAWIQGYYGVYDGDTAPIHITGIGVLQKPGSSSRAFKEAARILRASVAWTRICQAIACSLMQSLRGEALTMEAS